MYLTKKLSYNYGRALSEKNTLCAFLAEAAYRSLIEELITSPKPGLVDRISNGAHKDMTFKTFINSANALAPYFKKIAESAYDGYMSPELVFHDIRKIGKAAEIAMYQATDGVNTHKGIIFSIGILTAATVIAYQRNKRFILDEIIEIEQEMVRETLLKELCFMNFYRPQTHGEDIYQKYGSAGVRGVAIMGYREVVDIALPEMIKGVNKGYEFERVKLQTLLTLMARTEDSNILSRSDENRLREVQTISNEFVSSGGAYRSDWRDFLIGLDKQFIEWNISPGGSADLLAVTVFLYILTRHDRI